MTKFADTTQLIEMARDANFPGVEDKIDAVIQAVDDLAKALAEQFGVRVDTRDEPAAFGGLLAGFSPARENQPCPEGIDRADPHGDWE